MKIHWEFFNLNDDYLRPLMIALFNCEYHSISVVYFANHVSSPHMKYTLQIIQLPVQKITCFLTPCIHNNPSTS